MLGQGFQNGTHIADRHFLVEQVLQHLVQRGQGQHARHQVFGQLRHLLGHAIQQLLCFLATKQLRRMLADNVVEMGGDHGTGFHHGIALDLRLLFQGAFDPDCRQTKGRVDSLFPRQRARRRARVNCQPAPRIGVAAADLYPFHQDAVACRRQIHIVADMHHRWQEAHVLGEFFTDTADTP